MPDFTRVEKDDVISIINSCVYDNSGNFAYDNCLKPYTSQESIDARQEIINQMADGEDKDNANSRLNIARNRMCTLDSFRTILPDSVRQELIDHRHLSVDELINLFVSIGARDYIPECAKLLNPALKIIKYLKMMM